jgi:nitrate reductase assembly molybdenum cofactor insertion protein NarJ
MNLRQIREQLSFEAREAFDKVDEHLMLEIISVAPNTYKQHVQDLKDQLYFLEAENERLHERLQDAQDAYEEAREALCRTP